MTAAVKDGKPPIAICTLNVWRSAPLDDQPYTGGGASRQPLDFRRRALEGFFETYAPQVDVFATQECTEAMHEVVFGKLRELGFGALDTAGINQERVYFKRRRISVAQSSERLLVGGLGDSNHATFCVLVVDGRHRFGLANTHLSWQGGGWDAVAGPQGGNPRFAQMADIVQNVPDEPVVVIAGDLNDVYAPIRVARDGLGMLPCFAALGRPSPATFPTPGSCPVVWDCDNFAEKTYDWILSRGVRVVSAARIDYNIAGVYPSDHYPVMATFDFDETVPDDKPSKIAKTA